MYRLVWLKMSVFCLSPAVAFPKPAFERKVGFVQGAVDNLSPFFLLARLSHLSCEIVSVVLFLDVHLTGFGCITVVLKTPFPLKSCNQLFLHHCLSMASDLARWSIERHLWSFFGILRFSFVKMVIIVLLFHSPHSILIVGFFFLSMHPAASPPPPPPTSLPPPNITHSTSHTRRRTPDITHSISHTWHHTARHHTPDITHSTSPTQHHTPRHHTLNITHSISHTQRHTLNITHSISHIHHLTSNITQPTSHTHRTLGAVYRGLCCSACRDWRPRAVALLCVSLLLWFAVYRGSAGALAAIDVFRRWLSFACLCYCDLQSIGSLLERLPRLTPSGGVALAAIDAFGRWLSFACLCYCDLQSIGGLLERLPRLTSSGGGSPLRVSAIVICSL